MKILDYNLKKIIEIDEEQLIYKNPEQYIEIVQDENHDKIYEYKFKVKNSCKRFILYFNHNEIISHIDSDNDFIMQKIYKQDKTVRYNDLILYSRCLYLNKQSIELLSK